jgi:hypothetical protein
VYQKFLFLTGLVLASTAQAQAPERTLMRHIAVDYSIAGTPTGRATWRVDPAPGRINGDQALLNLGENRTPPAELPGLTDGVIDGPWALLGAPRALRADATRAELRSSFRAEVRGDVIDSSWGEAEFGAVHTVDPSPAAFVVSLGVCGEQSAVLFMRRNGTSLEVGRYRVSEPAQGVDEIMALVTTGSSTHPTGAFRGVSGWLLVSATSERFIAGQFEIDAVGFTAAEPEQEGRHVNVTGSFSATASSSSFRVCENVE